MARSDGISGLAVGVVATGGLLIWSAIRNVNPLDTLREVLGRPSAGRPISTPFASVRSGVRTVTPSGGAGGGGAGGSDAAARLVEEARRLIGTKYVWGGTSESGVDCSGLVVLCLRRIGVSDVPRFTTATFGNWASRVGARRLRHDEFQAGDIILRTGHMAIAVSATRMIHAPGVGSNVKEADIYSRSSWWGWRLFGVGRGRIEEM